MLQVIIFSARIATTYDSEFKWPWMDIIGVVQVTAKLALHHNRTASNLSEKKKVCLLASCINYGANHLVCPNEIYFHQKIRHISIETTKKIVFLRISIHAFLKFCKWWTWSEFTISNALILLQVNKHFSSSG